MIRSYGRQPSNTTGCTTGGMPCPPGKLAEFRSKIEPVHPICAIVRQIAPPLLLWTACAILSSGQPPPPAPPVEKNTAEISSHDLPATFSSRVNLVLVRAV